MIHVPLTPAEFSSILDGFARVSLVCGFVGGLVFGACWSLFGAAVHWGAERARASARIKAARARAQALGGMGVPPMVDLSRATCPAQGSGGLLARLSSASLRSFTPPGASGRVIKHSEEPRPEALSQACPSSRLESRRAAGAPGPSTTPAGGVDPVGMPCIPDGSASPSRLSI